MCNTRCRYCNKQYAKKDGDKCTQCDKEFKEVMSKVARKYDGAIKGLAGK